MAAAPWRLRLGAQAEKDFLEIVGWTAEQFGVVQARFYRQTIMEALEELRQDPAQVGVRNRNEIMSGLKTFHIARHGRRGRHFILFRVPNRVGENIIEILRILHDAMDLARHVPANNAEEDS